MDVEVLLDVAAVLVSEVAQWAFVHLASVVDEFDVGPSVTAHSVD